MDVPDHRLAQRRASLLRRLALLLFAAVFVYLAIESGRTRDLRTGWLFMVYCSVLAIVVGVAFRRAAPFAVAIYRNGLQPGGRYRSAPLLGLPFGVLFLAWLVVAGLVVSTTNTSEWPHWARSLSVWGSFAYLLIIFGLSLVLSHDPPRWLMPPWLRAERDRSVPVRRDWFGRLTVAGGILCLAFGLVAAAAGVLGATGASGL